MATVPTCIPKSDLRAVIQFLTLENVPGCEIHRRLCAAYKDPNIITRSTVNRWVQMFKDGRTNTVDEQRNGRPSNSVNEERVAIVSAILEEDRRQTIRQIEQQIAAEYA